MPEKIVFGLDIPGDLDNPKPDFLLSLLILYTLMTSLPIISFSSKDKVKAYPL